VQGLSAVNELLKFVVMVVTTGGLALATGTTIAAKRAVTASAMTIIVFRFFI
jgi:hypothetical protein